MRPSSSAGLLLLLVAFLGVAGFLTGNLDRWLGALFGAQPAVATGAAPAGARVSIGATTQRGVA